MSGRWDFMPLLTSNGMIWIETLDDDDRSLIGSYWNAVHRFRDTGDLSDLQPFTGQKVDGIELETDPDQLEFWAYQGELDFESIYEGS